MKNLLLIFAFISLPALAQLTNESELSLIQSGGNAEAQTSNARTTNTYKWDIYSLLFGGHYTYGENADGVAVRNWDINVKSERVLSPKLSVVLGELIEGNRFTDIKARYNSDLGLKYYYDKTDVLNFFSEVTYRYTIEDRYSDIGNTYDHRARLYNEYDRKYSETLQYKFLVEYIPNFTNGSDYLVNGEVSLTAILNTQFSLKVSYRGMYDNRPANPSFKNYDYLTTTALVAKF